MKIVAVGLSHKTAPVALREKLSFTEAEVPACLEQLTALASVQEAAILSTCNRVEIFFAATDADLAVNDVTAWLGETRGIGLEDLEPHLYAHTEEEGIRHGFRVAASLDSQIVGEPQILGQMKQAYHLATESKCSGTVLGKFFHRTFQVAKRVRTETSIAENPVSISYAAVELSKKIFGNLEEKACLLIGAGEMCELAARHLVGNGVKEVLVTNRTFARAEEFARTFDGEAFPLEALGENLHRADIIVSSTGATTYLVDPKMATDALKRRKQAPMFFIDIAVPRDLDPAIGEVDSAFLYDIDDLGQIVEANRKGRDTAAQQAEEIIAAEVVGFSKWLLSLNVAPTIVEMRETIESIRKTEIRKALDGLPGLSTEERKRVEQMGRLIVNKILHTPTVALKQLAGRGDGDLYVDAARKLFGLDEKE